MQGGQGIINAAVKNFGKLDILINIAGNYLVGSILEQTEADWDSQINVHLKGAFSCTQAAAKEMVKQKSGRVVNISSPTPFAYKGFGSRSIAYSAAKSGIVGFTMTAAMQLAEHGITVNGIIPGAVTKLFPGPPRPAGAGAAAPTPPGVAPGRPSMLAGMGSPDFVAPTIVYLCTDDARGITGRFFHASGSRVGVYAYPFDLNTTNSSVYKVGQWTIDEVKEVIPRML
jgi:NAD(P)-dependent dehydrogenase (short-subunit alcohol dehydrogenase family)